MNHPSFSAAARPATRRWHEMLSWTPGISTLGDVREFMQQRVKRYLGFLLVFFGAFYVLDTSTTLLEQAFSQLLGLGHLAHLGLVIGLSVTWHWLRSGERSARALAGIEVATTLGIAGVALAVLQSIPKDQIPAGPMLAMALMLVARSAIVPSTGWRTFAVGCAVTLVIVFGYYLRGPDAFVEFAPPWMLAFTFASAFVSRSIYGLQQQVRQVRQLGQYVLERRLGAGGMGVVYRASHRLLRRPTAIKLMSPGRTTQHDSARFEHEVRQTARLSHPNTVTIYDYGRSAEGVFYYAMELLDGATLETIVSATGQLSAARTARIMAAVAGALAEAHGIQLIHRDIKPTNIMLCEQGGEVDVVKVLDFGLVKDLAGDSSLTHDNALTGTPAFMSPETIRDPQCVSPRSDLYALGAVGYYLLTGRQVFEGKTIVEVCSHHLISPVVPPSERVARSFPGELEALILRCLAKDPNERPASALELRRSLMGLQGLGIWSDDDALAWWARYRPTLFANDSNSDSPIASTLAVDMSRRT